MMFWKNRKVAVLLGGLLSLCLLTGCGRTETVEKTGILMDTIMQYQLVYEGGTEEETLADRWMALGEELEDGFLSRRVAASEMAAINASAGREEGYALSPDMEDLLTLCLSLSEESGGAFDITLGALISLWDLDAAAETGGEGFVPPSEEAVEEALALCGYEKVSIRDHRIYLPKGMILDLGAVGKGYYLDRCCEELPEKGLRSALITAGGSVLTECQQGERTFQIGIADPFGESSLYGVIRLEGRHFISTSGDYERYVEYEGVRYHHILDPVTGYPASSGVRSVTILSDNGTLSDALSTACFVLGEEKGTELARKMGAEAIFILEDGSCRSTLSAEIYENGSQQYLFSL